VADAKAPRDFFISFNSADLAFAEAIDATFYHPRDLGRRFCPPYHAFT
jgi:hypothetical protein